MKIHLVYVVFAAFFFAACDMGGESVGGNGDLKSENRNIRDVTKIKVSGNMDVFVETGAPSVKVEADENLMRYIDTEADNDWLEIRTRDNTNISSPNPIKVYVTVRNISDLTVTGSGNITCDKKFSSSNKMSFSVTGSGKIIADINAPAVDATITGSGNLFITGETRNADIQIMGSGNYNSPDLKAENASVNIAGSGDANLFADVKLKATIAGSGDVKYKGNAVVESHIAGSGSVMKVP